MGRDLLTARGLLFSGAWLLYVATANPGVFWLDSGELAGAAATLGIPHPPGHPLYVILGHGAALIPVGSLGFRVALLSAACAAWAVTLVYDLAQEAGDDLVDGEAPLWPALLVASVFGISQAVWLQAVRAEVYTLHLVLALWLTRLALRWARTTPPRAAAPPIFAAFVIGLGSGNHHYLLAFHLPALAVLLAADAPARRALPRRLPALVAAGAAGLLAYALLPLRAARDPLINYGDPRTLERLVDVVTARVFQQSVSEASTPLAENLVAALHMYAESVGPVLLLAGAAGLAILLRRRTAVGLCLTLAVLGNLATKVLMDLDPTNPDAAGYFQTGMAVVAVAAGVALAWGARHEGRLPYLSSGIAGGLAAVLALVAAGANLERVELSTYRSPQAVDTHLASQVAPGGLMLTSFFGLHFNRLHHAAAEGHRPDALPVHQGFEAHIDEGRPLEARLRRRDPALAELAAARRRKGAFPTDAVLAHADARPMYVEPTFSLPLPPERLEYAGGLLRVVPEGAPPRPRVDAQRADQEALWAAVGPELRAHREARVTLSLLWLQLAVVRLQQGEAEGASLALDFVDRITGGSPYADRLRPAAQSLAEAERWGGAGERRQVLERIRRTDFRAILR